MLVRLDPDEHYIKVTDTMTIPDRYGNRLEFALHEKLRVFSTSSGNITLEGTQKTGPVPVSLYSVEIPDEARKVTLVYEGTIDHPLEQRGKEYARDFRETPGLIDEQGVFLSGNSFWYPIIDGGLISFSLEVEGPPDWDAVSQGGRLLHEKKKMSTVVKWDSPEPQEEVFLIAARFTEYVSRAGKAAAMVFLREPDDKLAEKYLEATARYISMYERLIGPYPYAKFALIENFWETGYGMPSFTLLGPKIIRFPFIIVSSYPHEILHNWWGNSVYPDYLQGNWSEGLTAYLSDHLLKEQQGKGAEYRQTTLQKYADYVLQDRDFPLTDFRSRHSSPSEAIGYGKSLMFFHMLRRRMGDGVFRRGLQDFYRENKFSFASFEDIRTSFEKVSGMDLGTEFDQWVTRTGAPKVGLEAIRLSEKNGTFDLSFRIVQSQKGKPYLLHVPLAVTFGDHDGTWQSTVDINARNKELHLQFSDRPVRIDLDPEFDLFRKLDRDEVPPALSQVFGAKKMVIILPAAKSRSLAESYERLAEILKGTGPDEVEVVHDNLLERLPDDRSVIIMGWENFFASKILSSLGRYGVTQEREGVVINNVPIHKEGNAVVLVSRNPDNKDQAIAFVAADVPESMSGLGRKLPHYNKYSYLVFEGDEPQNIMKGRWSVTSSPMTAYIDTGNETGELPAMGKLTKRESLIAVPPVFSSERMIKTIRTLSDESLEGRGFGSKGLEKAAEFISDSFSKEDLMPGGDVEGSFYQEWEEDAKDQKGKAKMKNVIGIMPGTTESSSGQWVVLGAHYDALGTGWPEARKVNVGKVHPGADDNASGVAVLVELARILKETMKPDRTLVFVTFAGEEAGKIGSEYFVKHFKRMELSKCIGMVNIDTVGRLENKKLLVLGGSSAREWVHIFRGAGYVTGVDVEMVTEDLDSSDQVSFERAGIPAVQVFTGPHQDYHMPSDTAEGIDASGLMKVASVVKEVIEYLSAKDSILTNQLEGGEQVHSPVAQKKRKVSLGTVPDFGYGGRGCRITDVLPGSPAATCGLQKGDVILAINGREVDGLKGLSNLLKTMEPGEKIVITVLRDGNELQVETILEER